MAARGGGESGGGVEWVDVEILAPELLLETKFLPQTNDVQVLLVRTDVGRSPAYTVFADGLSVFGLSMFGNLLEFDLLRTQVLLIPTTSSVFPAHELVWNLHFVASACASSRFCADSGYPLGSHSDPLSLFPPSASPIVTMLMAKLLLRVWRKLGLLLPRLRGSCASLRERVLARARESGRGAVGKKLQAKIPRRTWRGERERVGVYTERYKYLHQGGAKTGLGFRV